MKSDAEELARHGDPGLLAELIAWASTPPDDDLDSALELDPGEVLLAAELVEDAGLTSLGHETQIGPYKLLGRIGEGGMGIVYLARQQWPVRRTVALKVIKPGMDAASVVARFKAERQTLAMMDHPNIAKVLDAGESADGPYIAMEYVRGKSITDFCDEHELGVRPRLELFISVARAIQHAHQKKIIHRDLKPTNVLVTLSDEQKPLAKVIDFGVAKALSADLCDQPMLTLHGGIIGTPQYMSPEQHALGLMSAETRSDVYALGVLLYELLTGSTPFQAVFRDARSIASAMCIIREQDPQRASARVLACEKPAQIAGLRGTSPSELANSLKGDLDRIVAKCLERDPADRYQKASDLADDIRRYLNDEPVLASRPSLPYRCRKFARRHRVFIRIAAGLLVLIVAAGWVFWRQHIHIMKAQGLAKEATLIVAQHEAEKELEMRQYLGSLLALVQPAIHGTGRDAHVVDLLDDAARWLEKNPFRDPRMQLMVREDLGATYQSLGMDHQAGENFQSAYELSRMLDGPEESRQTLHDAAQVAFYSDIDFARRTYDRAGERLGDRDQVTLEAANSYARWLLKRADQALYPYEDAHLAEQILRRIVQVADETHVPPKTACRFCSQLTKLLIDEHRYPEAERVARDAFAKASADPSARITTRGPLGFHLVTALADQGKLPEAVALASETYAFDCDVIGSFHGITLRMLRLYAQLLCATGRYAQADRLLEDQVRLARATIKGNDDALVDLLMTWGRARVDSGHAKDGFAILLEAARMQRAIFKNQDSSFRTWLREALIIRAGSPDHSAGTLGAQVLCALADLWRDNPNHYPYAEALGPASIQFSLYPWNPVSQTAVVKGTLADPVAQAAPAPGLYLLSLRAPVAGARDLRQAMWVAVCDWDIQYATSDVSGEYGPPIKIDPAQLGPVERRKIPGLAMIGDFRDAPVRTGEHLMTIATTQLKLPAGRYRFSASSVDGARVYVDDRRVINAWSPHRARRDFADLYLEQGAHAVRVEHFQRGTRRFLWLSIQPLSAQADALAAAHGSHPLRTLQEAMYEQDGGKHFEAFAASGSLLAQQCRFREALDQYDKAIAMEPAEPLWWQQTALVALSDGDVAEYEKRRSLLLRNWRESDDPLVRARTALISFALPTEQADMHFAQDGARSKEVIALQQWSEGLSSYRQRDYRNASQLLAKAAGGPVSPFAHAAIEMVHALSLARSGDSAAAQQLFWSTISATSDAPPKTEIDGFDVQDWMLYRTFRAEAAKMLPSPQVLTQVGVVK